MLDALNYFVLGFVTGYVWNTVWAIIKKIWVEAKKAREEW